jgi:hypothetical protein
MSYKDHLKAEKDGQLEPKKKRYTPGHCYPIIITILLYYINIIILEI